MTAGGATGVSHGVQRTLCTNASGCQQMHVRFVGCKRVTFARRHLRQRPHPESLVQDLQPAD